MRVGYPSDIARRVKSMRKLLLSLAVLTAFAVVAVPAMAREHEKGERTGIATADSHEAAREAHERNAERKSKAENEGKKHTEKMKKEAREERKDMKREHKVRERSRHEKQKMEKE